MQEVSYLVTILSLAINAGLVYYSFRLLLIFRGGKKSKPWMYISTGVLTLAIGSCFFALRYLLGFPENILRPLGGIMMLIGGVLMLIGMRSEYRSWSFIG